MNHRRILGVRRALSSMSCYMFATQATVSIALIMAPSLGMSQPAPAPTAATPTELMYVGDLRIDGKPFEGVAQIKLALMRGPQVLWSNDGSSLNGDEPRSAVDVSVHSGVLTVILGRNGTATLPQAVLQSLDGTETLRLWVRTTGEFARLPDQTAVATHRPEEERDEQGNLRVTYPSFQQVYNNSTEGAALASIQVASTKSIIIFGVAGTPALKLQAPSANSDAARFIGRNSFGADVVPRAPMSVFTVPGSTFPTGWGDLAVSNTNADQGIAVEVDDDGSTGTTRIWTKGSAGLFSGSEKLVITSQARSTVDAFVLKDALIGIGMASGQEPEAELHIRNTRAAPNENAAIYLDSESGNRWQVFADNSTNGFSLWHDPVSGSPSPRFFIDSVGRATFGGTVEGELSLTTIAADGNSNCDLVLRNATGQRWGLLAGGDNSFRVRNRNTGVDALSVTASNNHVSVHVLEIVGGSDIAEPFQVAGNNAGNFIPGTVVVLDDTSPGRVRASSSEYDRRVAGVVSGAGGVRPGVTLSQEQFEGGVNVALAGRVYALADASYGEIEPGDLLTTSATRGHAMRVNDYERAGGAAIGKAMSRLESGRGLVLVLVSLQ